MIIDSEIFDQLLGRAISQSPRPLPKFSGMTFGAALQLELACQASDVDLAVKLRESMSDDHLLTSIRGQLQTGFSANFRFSDSPSWEVFSLRSRSAFVGTDWDSLRMRFVRAVRIRWPGVTKFAEALSVCLTEMADNVFQHAAAHGQEVPALAGYAVTPTGLCFVVTDLGRGAKTSLQTNPKWQCLNSEHEALDAIIFQRASRRVSVPFGDGYKDLFRALIDRNAVIVLKSIDAKQHLQQLPSGERSSTSRSRVAYPGFTVEVSVNFKTRDTGQTFYFTSSPDEVNL